jgi:hypothetical protein
VLDRDINAAQNILTFATAGTAGIQAAGQAVSLSLKANLIEGGSPMALALGSSLRSFEKAPRN